ncbi:MAG: aminotransferase class IV [Bacteroidia bacterium]|nr:aminotransferase class IV [Bacteroidia bacterium]
MNFDSNTNRSFLYGDGFFDTFLLENGVCKNYNLHYLRNKNSAQLLEMDWKDEWTLEFFTNMLKQIYNQNNCKILKVRFTFYRNSSGGYLPDNNKIDFEIKTENFFHNASKIYKAGLYLKATKPINFFSNIKSTSSLLYVMASLEMKKQNWNEIILLNKFGNVCESLNSNIFLKKGDTYYTPPLSEGCVDGTYRTSMIINKAEYNVVEKSLKIDELSNGEIFLSNAVRGLTKVNLD